MRKSLKIVITTICCISALGMAAIFGRVRINTTPSYPVGIYLMTNAPIEKGVMVIFCPTDTAIFRQAKERGYIGAGFCPGGTGYMIKKIMAATNDRVEFSGAGVSVNGELLSNSKSMDKDLEGRPLPHINIAVAVLDANSVLLMSDYNPKSFDARYFGLVDKSVIISAVRPVWVW